MHSTNSKPTMSQCTILAERLLGFYGAPEVGDPEVFMAGMLELMQTYSQATVERMPSAVRGIPARFKFFPRIAEIKEAMDEWEAEHQRSQRNLSQNVVAFLPRPSVEDRPKHPGYNLKVPQNVRRYAQMCERAKLAPATEYKFDDDGSIWVPLTWWEQGALQKGVRSAGASLPISEAAE